MLTTGALCGPDVDGTTERQSGAYLCENRGGHEHEGDGDHIVGPHCGRAACKESHKEVRAEVAVLAITRGKYYATYRTPPIKLSEQKVAAKFSIVCHERWRVCITTSAYSKQLNHN